ncbi:MAG TPA: DEAD/DEAH box helicase [Phaeodactylibacter sp.]|nr:DEAD/DEAH box helicase [Phaeodactylibacter sp.]
MTFEDLNINNPLRNALADLGYVQPTPIQIESFPVIMSGRDMVGVAQTGTGKTFAYLLPLLRLLKYSTDGHPRIVILVPTRELVVQVAHEAEKLTKYMTARVIGVYGGTNINTQKQAVHAGVDVLVATPGRFYDLAMTRAFKVKHLKKLVIDEVDEMLNLGFRTQLKNILDLLPERRQNLLFSATLTPDVENLINDYFYQPKKIEIAAHGTPLEQILQHGFFVPNFNTKSNLLQLLLQTDEDMNKVLVFVKTKKLADLLHEKLTPLFPEKIGVIHSNKSQNYRLRMVDEFDKNELQVLIATDIIARGLDISEVSHVINFDMPEAPADYMHRIGRTGRADQKGIAISFISEKEEDIHLAIEALMNKEIIMLPTPEDLVVSTELIEAEKETLAGDKNYFKAPTLKNSKGAFHQKLDKNKKVNRAKEKRQARMAEKKKARRSGKKK